MNKQSKANNNSNIGSSSSSRKKTSVTENSIRYNKAHCVGPLVEIWSLFSTTFSLLLFSRFSINSPDESSINSNTPNEVHVVCQMYVREALARMCFFLRRYDWHLSTNLLRLIENWNNCVAKTTQRKRDFISIFGFPDRMIATLAWLRS